MVILRYITAEISSSAGPTRAANPESRWRNEGKRQPDLLMTQGVSSSEFQTDGLWGGNGVHSQASIACRVAAEVAGSR